MITKTLDFYNLERKIFWILFVALGAVLFFGLYSFSALTFAVIDRDNMNNKAREIATVSSGLEAEYLSKINKITIEYAKEIGFVETTVKFASEVPPVKLSIAR